MWTLSQDLDQLLWLHWVQKCDLSRRIAKRSIVTLCQSELAEGTFSGKNSTIDTEETEID